MDGKHLVIDGEQDRGFISFIHRPGNYTVIQATVYILHKIFGYLQFFRSKCKCDPLNITNSNQTQLVCERESDSV